MNDKVKNCWCWIQGAMAMALAISVSVNIGVWNKKISTSPSEVCEDIMAIIKDDHQLVSFNQAPPAIPVKRGR